MELDHVFILASASKYDIMYFFSFSFLVDDPIMEVCLVGVKPRIYINIYIYIQIYRLS